MFQVKDKQTDAADLSDEQADAYELSDEQLELVHGCGGSGSALPNIGGLTGKNSPISSVTGILNGL